VQWMLFGNGNAAIGAEPDASPDWLHELPQFSQMLDEFSKKKP
jgi:hypothetical protein